MYPRKRTPLIVLCPIIIIIRVIADSNCVADHLYAFNCSSNRFGRCVSLYSLLFPIFNFLLFDKNCGRAFLGAFTKLRKATISFVMSVRLHGTSRLPLDGFS